LMQEIITSGNGHFLKFLLSLTVNYFVLIL